MLELLTDSGAQLMVASMVLIWIVLALKVLRARLEKQTRAPQNSIWMESNHLFWKLMLELRPDLDAQVMLASMVLIWIVLAMKVLRAR